MDRVKISSAVVTCAAAAGWLWCVPAFAYIDGGTASLIFQALIAGGLGVLLVVKQFWANIKAFFRSKFRGKASPGRSE